MNQLFFSIVIPTKDRPECVSILLESIKNQSFQNYEVIVSDNASKKHCKDVVDAVGDSRFLYYETQKALGICDSFESAIGHAQGQWIMMLGDKNILYPDALEKLYSVIHKENVQVVNFGQDYLSPDIAAQNLVCGKLKKLKRTGNYYRVDLQSALESHLSCKNLMASYENLWYIGNIYAGGVYKESFVKKIRLLHDSGRVFDGIVPDRYGAVEALCIADNIIWLDENICIYNSCGKNTWAGTLKKGYESLHNFVSQSREDKDQSARLLIPGVIASVNNIVASDYYNAVEDAVSLNYYKRKNVNINRVRLAALVEKELLGVKHISDNVLDDQKKLLDAYIGQFDESEQKRFLFYRRQLKQRKRWLLIKAGIDRIFRKGMNSRWEPAKAVCLALEKRLSKDTVFIKDLSDVR